MTWLVLQGDSNIPAANRSVENSRGQHIPVAWLPAKLMNGLRKDMDVGFADPVAVGLHVEVAVVVVPWDKRPTTGGRRSIVEVVVRLDFRAMRENDQREVIHHSWPVRLFSDELLELSAWSFIDLFDEVLQLIEAANISA